MSAPVLRLKLGCAGPPLAEAWPAIERFLRAKQCPARTGYVVGLVFEEAVGNILEHACMEAPDCRIEIELRADAAGVVMSISDDGPPFDPCSIAPPPRPASLAAAPAGGRGIWLMRRMTQSMRYARVDGRNRLELCIALRGA